VVLITSSLIIKNDINTNAEERIYFNKRKLAIGRRDLSLVAAERGHHVRKPDNLVNGG
jgi:hypothetical protein